MTAKELIALLADCGLAPVVLGSPETGPLVVVAPELAGRVMAAASNPGEELSAYLAEGQIRDGFSQDGKSGWNNFGGAERIWLAPEGGPHGFMFAGHDQTYDRYRLQESHHAIRFQVLSASATQVTMEAACEPVTASGNRLRVHIKRTIRLLEDCPFAAQAECAGFESETEIKNAGDRDWTQSTGVPAIWTLGQFRSTPSSIIVVPIRSGNEADLGPRVITDYFQHLCPSGRMPDEAWQVGARCILLRADGSVQTKIDVTRHRTVGRLASFDFEAGICNAVEFDVHPTKPYAASYWLPWQGDPRNGAALSAFCLAGDADGPNPPFHELETFSPAAELPPGGTLTHRARTWSIRAGAEVLSRIAEESFHAGADAMTHPRIATPPAHPHL